MSSELGSIKINTNVLGDFTAITGVNFEQVSNESFFNVLSALTEWTRDVSDNVLAVLLTEYLVEECARLFVVVVGVLVWVSSD